MKQVKAFVTAHFNGNHFAIVYDAASGRKNRYTVLQWRVGKQAKVIGRELPLGYAKKLVDGKSPSINSSTNEKISVTHQRTWYTANMDNVDTNALSNYTVVWGECFQYNQGCDTWPEVRGIISAVKKTAPPSDAKYLDVRGRGYSAVESGLTEDEEIELEYLL